MENSVKKVVNSFPEPVITSIIGSPTYKYLVKIFEIINGGAASVQTNMVGGTLGYLALAVTTAVCATLSTNSFIFKNIPDPLQFTLPMQPESIKLQSATNLTSKPPYSVCKKFVRGNKIQILESLYDIYMHDLKAKYAAFGNLVPRCNHSHQNELLQDHPRRPKGELCPYDRCAQHQSTVKNHYQP